MLDFWEQTLVEAEDQAVQWEEGSSPAGSNDEMKLATEFQNLEKQEKIIVMYSTKKNYRFCHT